MIIAVKHIINSPANFWAAAQESLPKLPELNVQRVLLVLPNKAMTEATCVWEADSIEALDAYLRTKVNNASTESYYEVNTENSLGLPM
jgi:hypothetical protein